MEKKIASTQPVYYHTLDIKERTRNAALACYGVVDVARREDTLRADKRVKKGLIEDAAIYVKKSPNRTFTVDVYLVLSKEVKLTEALVECQKTILYQLNKWCGGLCTAVNVFGESLASN